jgi:4-hydroxy-tetrahydrodipicolinate reductase
MTNGKLTSSPHPPNTYRVVQWSAGRMGKKSIRAVVDHPDLELVGLYVYSEDKKGVDAGVLAGIEPLGIAATRDIDDVVGLAPDCLLYMQEGFDLDDLTHAQLGH